MFGLLPKKRTKNRSHKLPACGISAATPIGSLSASKNLEFLDGLAENFLPCAELLTDLAETCEVNDFDRVVAITDSEHVGDKIAHETLDRQERTDITPVHRDDIHCRITHIAAAAVAQRMLYDLPLQDASRFVARI